MLQLQELRDCFEVIYQLISGFLVVLDFLTLRALKTQFMNHVVELQSWKLVLEPWWHSLQRCELPLGRKSIDIFSDS